MNDNPDIVETPTVAETKEEVRPSHQVLALKNEIEKFAGSQADLLEQISKQDEIIEDQKHEIEANQDLTNILREAFIREVDKSIRLEEAMENSIRERTLEYKQQITLLKERIRYLTTKTEIDQALLEELRRDKEKLYEKLMRK